MSLENVWVLYAVFTLFQILCLAATHDELPQCGITGVYRTRQTVLQSPNYPDNYSPSTCLDFVIRSPYRCPTKFHIQFLDFRLESSLNCSNDYLAIGLENDTDDMDILCGQVVGIKKYHTPDGVLRLRFFADDSPWTTARGFKLLITRLACESDELLRAQIDSSDDDTEVVNAQESLPQNVLPILLRNLSLQTQHVPYPLPALFGLNYPTNYPTTLLPMRYNGLYVPNTQRNQLAQQPVYQQSQTGSNNGQPCLPAQPEFGNTLPQYFLRSHEAGQQQQLPLIPDQYTNWRTESSTENAQTRQQVGSGFIPGTSTEPCCASSFVQKRFYLSSPSFPRTAFTSLLPAQQRDCEFQIEKASQNICRLRVEFKFFDFGQTYSGTGSNQGNIEVAIGTSKDVCTEDFIEIDEERFCGCRSGYVYNSFWGLGKKIIRMRMGYSGIPSSGFLLDIIQEDCNGLQQVPSHLAGTQNFLNGQGAAGIQNIGLAQQSNGLSNLGQQPSSINFLNGLNGGNGLNGLSGLNAVNGLNGLNGQQHFITNQQQPSLVAHQLYPINQQNGQRNNPQNNPFWMLPQQQLPLVYPMPQFRSTRSLEYPRSESAHKPLALIETNSTRKEYVFFDRDEALAQARSSDEPDDLDRVDNPTQRYAAALRARCSFDAMDVLRLSVDYNWLVKPTCYSPQGRWFSNLFG